jgi:hypothetical protein
LGLIRAMFNRPMERFKSCSSGAGNDPSRMKQEYLDKRRDIHGIPRLRLPCPMRMGMSRGSLVAA